MFGSPNKNETTHMRRTSISWQRRWRFTQFGKPSWIDVTTTSTTANWNPEIYVIPLNYCKISAISKRKVWNRILHSIKRDCVTRYPVEILNFLFDIFNCIDTLLSCTFQFNSLWEYCSCMLTWLFNERQTSMKKNSTAQSWEAGILASACG